MSNLSHKVVGKFDQYHTLFLSERYYNLIYYATFAVCPVREVYSHTQPLNPRGERKMYMYMFMIYLML